MSAALLFALFGAVLVFAVVGTASVPRPEPEAAAIPTAGPDPALAYWRRLARRRLAGWRMAERERNAARAAMRAVPTGGLLIERNLLCLHPFEGSWRNPNFGGLGLKLGFQRRYGPVFLAKLGTADHWSPSMQLATAAIAVLETGGYGGWSSRGHCGL